MRQDSIVKPTQAAIEELMREGRPPTVGRVAAALSLSSRSLQRHLQDAGFNHREIVLKVRLDLAQRLLTETNRSIRDIGSKLGYKDASHFSRFFVRMTGVPPSTYRRQH